MNRTLSSPRSFRVLLVEDSSDDVLFTKRVFGKVADGH